MAPIESELIDYKDESTNQIFQAYVARDTSHKGPRPVILIFPTFKGRTEAENEKAHRLAELGYIGFAADLYGKGIVGSSMEENRKLMQPLREDRPGILFNRLKLVLETAQKLSYVDPKKVSAIGYCFGGMCVLDMARDPGLGLLGVVSLHGSLTKADTAPHLTSKITTKVLVCHGFVDKPEQFLPFGQEMTERTADWQLHCYGHAVHGFTHIKDNDENKFNEKADRRSWEALRYFLNECLS